MTSNSTPWRDIEGYEGMYQVSADGRVRGLNREVQRIVGHPQTQMGQFLKQATSHRGYRRVKLYRDGDSEMKSVHRLVAEAFLSNQHALPEVNHINGDKSDNRVENLEWCTSDQNHCHASDMGLKATGESNGQAKLSDQDVSELRRRAHSEPSKSQRELAKEFGISQRQVGRILRNEHRISELNRDEGEDDYQMGRADGFQEAMEPEHPRDEAK